MNRKTKIVAVAAAIVLPATAIAGGIAQAQSQHAPTSQRSNVTGLVTGSGEESGTDTDNLQQGDQTGADKAGRQSSIGPTRAAVSEGRQGSQRSGASQGSEESGTDTDNLQEGDQTGADTGGRQASVGHQAVTRVAHAVVAKPNRAVGHSVQSARTVTPAGSAAGPADENSGESESGGGADDGAGGHQDPAGNVDHQFNGEE